VGLTLFGWVREEPSMAWAMLPCVRSRLGTAAAVERLIAIFALTRKHTGD
jgi:hypothetical protein